MGVGSWKSSIVSDCAYLEMYDTHFSRDPTVGRGLSFASSSDCDSTVGKRLSDGSLSESVLWLID